MFARILTSLLVVLALAAPDGAAAHIRVQPEEAAAGAYTELSFNVPSESADAATTRVEVRFPPGVAYAYSKPVAGWSVDVRTAKPAKSAITGQTAPASTNLSARTLIV